MPRPPRAAWIALAAAVVAAAAVLLVVVARPSRAGAAEVAAAPAVARPGAATTGLAPVAAEVAPGGTELASAGRAAVARPGVRLAGDGRLEGRVVDVASGDGVGGARVDLFATPPAGREVLRRMWTAGRFEPGWVRRLDPVATTVAGGAGRFAFAGVRRGTYYLEAGGERWVGDQPTLVRVDSEGAGGPATVRVRAGGRVVGVVERADGRPVAGARVAVYPGETAFLRAARDGDLRFLEGEADAGGRFVVAGVPPGPGWDVAAHGPGLALAHATGVEVRAGEDAHVRVVVPEGGVVRGRVLARAVDPDGAERLVPAAGASVAALPRGLRDQNLALEVLETTAARVGADGSYVLRRVPAGEVDVVAFLPGLVPGRGAPVRVADGGTSEAEPLVLEGGPTVTLTFVDDAGRPVEGVSVSWWVIDLEALAFEPTFSAFFVQAVPGFSFPASGADGTVVAGPFPGDAPYPIFCYAAGHEFELVEWDPDDDGPTRTVTLGRGGALEGIVMDVSRAEPVPRFRVRGTSLLEARIDAPSALDPTTGARWFEDESGRFRIDALAAGRAELLVSAPGYLPEEVEVDVRPGETTRGVIVRLRPGGTIRGRVLDADGEPVADAQVAAFDERGRPAVRRPSGVRRSADTPQAWLAQEIALGSMEIFSEIGVLAPGFATTGADGAFELVEVPEGTVVLHAVHRDFADARSEPLAVVPGEPLEGVEIRMGRGGGVYGFVTDRFGEPVPGAVVLAVSPARMTGGRPSPRWVRQGGTDETGAYRIEHMEEGGWFLACTRGDEELSLTSFLGTLNLDLVTVPPGEMVRFDVVDSSAAAVRVHGRVTADGEPVTEGGLFAASFEAESVLGVDLKIAQVRRDGTYEFAGLAPGDYQLTWQGEGPEVRMEVTIPDVPEHRLDLALPGGGVAGRVVDAATGEPIRGAEVVLRRSESIQATGLLAAMIQREGRSARDWTGEDGRFAFERLQPGGYELVVGAPRWGELSGRYAPSDPAELEVVDGVVERGLEVRLAPSLELAGVVVDEGDVPVERARVLAHSPESLGPRPTWTRSGADGRFRLRGLAPGPYVVTASADEHADAPPVEVELGVETPAPDLRLVLHRGVEVRALVVGPGGAPVQGATGRLVAEGASDTVAAARGVERTIRGLLEGEGVSGPDGVLRLGRHAPGAYRLEASRGAWSGVVDPVRVQDGPAVEVVVRLTEAGG